MKMLREDYIALKSAILSFPKIREAYIQYKDHGLSDMRFRWDVLHATKFNTHNLYKYLNDDNVDTALREILKGELEKPVKNPLSGQALISALEANGFHGIIDKLNRGVPRELGANWTEEKIKPKEYFDPRSFRYTRVPTTGALKAFVLVGCKKGHWDPKTNSCKAGTETHVIFRPKSGSAKAAANPRFGQQISLWGK